MSHKDSTVDVDGAIKFNGQEFVGESRRGGDVEAKETPKTN